MRGRVCASNHLKDADEMEGQDPTWEGPVIPEERRREEGRGTSLQLGGSATLMLEECAGRGRW